WAQFYSHHNIEPNAIQKPIVPNSTRHAQSTRRMPRPHHSIPERYCFVACLHRVTPHDSRRSFNAHFNARCQGKYNRDFNARQEKYNHGCNVSFKAATFAGGSISFLPTGLTAPDPIINYLQLMASFETLPRFTNTTLRVPASVSSSASDNDALTLPLESLPMLSRTLVSSHTSFPDYTSTSEHAQSSARNSTSVAEGVTASSSSSSAGDGVSFTLPPTSTRFHSGEDLPISFTTESFPSGAGGASSFSSVPTAQETSSGTFFSTIAASSAEDITTSSGSGALPPTSSSSSSLQTTSSDSSFAGVPSPPATGTEGTSGFTNTPTASETGFEPSSETQSSSSYGGGILTTSESSGELTSTAGATPTTSGFYTPTSTSTETLSPEPKPSKTLTFGVPRIPPTTTPSIPTYPFPTTTGGPRKGGSRPFQTPQSRRIGFGAVGVVGCLLVSCLVYALIRFRRRRRSRKQPPADPQADFHAVAAELVRAEKEAAARHAQERLQSQAAEMKRWEDDIPLEEIRIREVGAEEAAAAEEGQARPPGGRAMAWMSDSDRAMVAREARRIRLEKGGWSWERFRHMERERERKEAEADAELEVLRAFYATKVEDPPRQEEEQEEEQVRTGRHLPGGGYEL
ncbi:hypothetical protein FN846DRAFT_984984, partial [Sphaerosporella brunnea]